MRGFFQDIERRMKAGFRPAQPRRGLARVAFWLLVATVVLFIVRLLPVIGGSVGNLPWLALAVLIGVSWPMIYRWARWRMMWKLRNRLLVTYLLVGLTPLVLFGILAAITAYALSGQFANFAANTEIDTELTQLADHNEALALHFEQSIDDLPSTREDATHTASVPPSADIMLATTPEVRVGIFRDGQRLNLEVPGNHALSSEVALPTWARREFRGLVLDHDHVFFRAINVRPTGSHTVAVITSLPLDTAFLGNVVAGLGRITMYPTVVMTDASLTANPRRPGQRAIRGRDRVRTAASQLDGVSAGVVPEREGLLDIPIKIPMLIETVNWQTGEAVHLVALVTSRPSLLYQRLFRESLGMGNAVRTALIVAATVFALLEILALIMAFRLSRTMTQSVADLYTATREVDQGRLDYRIQVSRKDQLAALSRSFNTMSESLARLLDEQKEKERLQNELAIAQEVQENLFPPRDVRLGGLELHGVCRPARTVSGDYYDFLALGREELCFALGDISGKGISAALLMASLHSAVRAYRFASEDAFFTHLKNGAGLHELAGPHKPNGAAETLFQSPGRVLCLLNHHLYRSTQPEKYATLFLAHYQADTSTLRYSNGGQLPPLVLRTDGTIERLHCGGTVVGLLDGMQYEDGAVRLRAGDLLIAYSDGVTEPENEFGDFGEARLLELVHENRHLPLRAISDCVMRALDDWIGGAEQPDDITMVLARQR